MKKFKKIAVAASLFVASSAFAAPSTTIEAVNAVVGATGVAVQVDYSGTALGNPNGVVGFQVKFTYDNTKVQVAAGGLAACSAVYTCTDDGSSINMVAFTFPSAELPDSTFDITFDLQAGAVVTDVIALAIVPPQMPNVDGEEYTNFAAAVVPANPPSIDGSITVVAGPQPDYSSVPVGGTTIALNGSIGTNPTADVVITNAGPAMAPDLTGSCALNGGDAASFSIVSGSPFTVAQGANSTVTVDCDATAATMAQLTTSLDCTHNGDGTTEASPVSYPLTCDIAAISPQYNSTPAGGTAIAMGSILQGGANPTATIDIDNDAGDATTTLTGTCTAPAPFIVTNGAFSVLQGDAADTVDIACDSSVAPAAYAEDLTCTHNGTNVASPVTYPMTCEVLAAAATGNQNPVNGTALSVIVAPGGSGTTSVTFSEVGGQGVDITDLMCSVTPGVGFAITAPGAFPATVPAAGTLPVVVTFTDPGDGSATAGSLDCTYNDGTGAVAVSYPLNFVIRAINVPALSMMGYLVLTLGFGLIGFFAFRRRA